MTRDPEVRDFYDADVPTDASPSPLRAVILAQAHEPGGAAVALFTTATLEAGAAAGAPVDEELAGGVAATVRELDLDPVGLRLHAPDAYLVQSALGDRLLPEGA